MGGETHNSKVEKVLKTLPKLMSSYSVVVISHCSGNKLPQNQRLNMTQIYCFTVLVVRSVKWVSEAGFLVEPLRSFWRILSCADSAKPQSCLCLCLVVTWFCPCCCRHIFLGSDSLLSLVRTLVITMDSPGSYFRVISRSPDPKLNHICKVPPSFLKEILFIFREGEGREKERERNTDGRETSIGCLSCSPQLGTEPATQACALTWN